MHVSRLAQRVIKQAMVMALAGAGSAMGQTATLQAVPTDLPYWEIYAMGLSADGSKISGIYLGNDGWYHSYRWSQAEGTVLIPELCTVESTYLSRISGDGNTQFGFLFQCVDTPECPFCGGWGAARWVDGQGTSYMGYVAGGNEYIGDPSEVHAASHDGSVLVGASTTVTEEFPDGAVHGFRWTAATGMVDLGEVPFSQQSWATSVSGDGSKVLVHTLQAYYDNDGELLSTPFETYLWTEENGFEQIPLTGVPTNLVNSQPVAISADGSTVIGIASTQFVTSSYGSFLAYRWTESDGLVLLGARPDLGLPHSRPVAASADGSIIVGTLIASNLGNSTPFIWDEAHGIRVLAEVLAQGGADMSDWVLKQVSGVSADGKTVAGWGYREVDPEFGLASDAWIATLSDGPGCPADFDGNGAVEPTDIAVFINAWLTSLQQGTLAGDFDGNGVVEPVDIAQFVSAWVAAIQNGC
ncbi:MAG: hypothetical protein KF745_14905 [Phycisphaeraceae bacterium]|nr:hypothetical protein [Phycisphaeraceae bacterium]